MGFFDAIKRALSHGVQTPVDDATRKRIRDAWGLDEDSPAEAAPGGEKAGPPGSEASDYDRAHWCKKLRKILNELPASQPQWHELMTEAHALNLDPGWIAQQTREGFTFLVRRAVSDRVISEDDHHALDLARKLTGIPEAEAERILHAIMAEASTFFGSPIKDEA